MQRATPSAAVALLSLACGVRRGRAQLALPGQLGGQLGRLVGTGAASEFRPGEGVLYLHLVSMTLAWAALFPAGVAAVALLRRAAGAPERPRLRLHVWLQCAGWLLSLVGFGAALVYCELFSSHASSLHARAGFLVVALAELQPLSAAIRPYAAGRGGCAGCLFFVLHRCIGYLLLLAGLANVALGIAAVFDFGYDELVLGTAVGLAAFGLIPVVMFALFASCRPNNAASKALVGFMSSGPHETAPGRSPNSPRQERQHVFRVTTLLKPTWCHQCHRFMWGFAGQGYLCESCGNVFCQKCVAQGGPCLMSEASAA